MRVKSTENQEEFESEVTESLDAAFKAFPEEQQQVYKLVSERSSLTEHSAENQNTFLAIQRHLWNQLSQDKKDYILTLSQNDFGSLTQIQQKFVKIIKPSDVVASISENPTVNAERRPAPKPQSRSGRFLLSLAALAIAVGGWLYTAGAGRPNSLLGGLITFVFGDYLTDRFQNKPEGSSPKEGADAAATEKIMRREEKAKLLAELSSQLQDVTSRVSDLEDLLKNSKPSASPAVLLDYSPLPSSNVASPSESPGSSTEIDGENPENPENLKMRSSH